MWLYSGYGEEDVMTEQELEEYLTEMMEAEDETDTGPAGRDSVVSRGACVRIRLGA